MNRAVDRHLVFIKLLCFLQNKIKLITLFSGKLYYNDMIPEIANTLLETASIEDNDRILEISNLISSDTSRKIIAKASSPSSPITIDEFKDVNKITMDRYLHVLENVGILMSIGDKNVRKLKITTVGRDIARILGSN